MMQKKTKVKKEVIGTEHIQTERKIGKTKNQKLK
jgi:hypothetical protein